MEILIIPSQEHPTLPLAEIKAVLKLNNQSYELKDQFKGIYVFKISSDNLKSLNILRNRLSLVHEISELLFSTSESKLISKLKNHPWSGLIDKSFAVRVKKMTNSSNFTTLNLERMIGSIIREKCYKEVYVDLENPETFIRVIIQDNKVLVGRRLFKIPKKHFFNLKPHKRPFFYPGSMSPKLARCMVNLSLVKSGERLLDPFCGTGGILLEAGMIGAHVIGADIDPQMVKGTKENLEYCGIHDYNIFQEDARSIRLPYKVKAIVTDPPYGISASTAGEKSQDLISQALMNMQHLLSKKGRICMATPHYMDIDKVLESTKFEIIEQHHIRMHRSLTRIISVIKFQ